MTPNDFADPIGVVDKPIDGSLLAHVTHHFVPEECFVHHLPANYARLNAGAKRGFGTVPAQNLLGSRVRRLLLRSRPSTNQIDSAGAPS